MSDLSIEFKGTKKTIPLPNNFQEFKNSFQKQFNVDEIKNFDFFYYDQDDDKISLTELSINSDFKDAQLYGVKAEFSELNIDNSYNSIKSNKEEDYNNKKNNDNKMIE